jgi:hypothetical protein
MYLHTVTESKKSWLLEAPDGRRFVLAKKQGVMSAFPEGSEIPVVSGKDFSFKAIRWLLEQELSKQDLNKQVAA